MYVPRYQYFVWMDSPDNPSAILMFTFSIYFILYEVLQDFRNVNKGSTHLAICYQMTIETRMHSSGMCTSHLLTISQHALCRGVCPGGCLLGGVCPGWCVCPGSGGHHPPPRTRGRHPPLWTEWQTGVKTLPCRNFIPGINKFGNTSDRNPAVNIHNKSSLLE